MVKLILALLGFVAAALAQESNANGPLFNPSEAPYFGPSAVVYPSLTSDTPISTHISRSRISSSISLSSSVANSTLSSTFSHNSTTAHSSTHSPTRLTTSAGASRTSSAATRSEESTASATAPAETGAAAMNLPGVVRVLVGGLAAGLAML